MAEMQDKGAADAPADDRRLAARQAMDRHDWQGLWAAASLMRQTAPGRADGWLFASIALRRLGREAEFRALLDEALRRFPAHGGLATLARKAGIDVVDTDVDEAAIRAAVTRADWPEAVRLADGLRAARPDEPSGYELGTVGLRGCKQMKRADKISRAGVERFPEHIGLLQERATTLQQLKRWEEAAACYAQLRHLAPETVKFFAAGANALAMQGLFQQAEALLDDGLTQFGRDVDLLVQRALIANRGEDLQLARARWEDVRTVAPNDRRLRTQLGKIDLAERLQKMEEAPAQDEAAGGQIPDDASDDVAVLKKFESLGGSCEFGLVQRVAGIEPLGLLRFAGIEADELVALLACELRDVGGDARTRIELNVSNEYMLIDTRFFRSHTFIKFDGADEDALLAKLRRRTVFLRDKLIKDLRQGTKIFLFRPRDGVLTDDTVAALHRAMRAIGPGTLLCLRNSEAGAGVAVEDRGDGLLLATIPGHNTKLSAGFVARERYAFWMTACRAALALLHQNPPEK